MRKIILITLILICAQALKAQHTGYTAVADPAVFREKFTAVAKKTETIKSDFTQEKNLSMLAEKISSKGKFWFKKENLLRMEYYKPYEYLMILNKDNMYIKDGKKETKIPVRSNKILQQINKIIVDCVQGAVFNNPDFIANPYENKDAYLIELTTVAKALKDFFNTIDIIIDKKDYSVTAIVMNEGSGDNTTLYFTNRELNTVIPDALFSVK